MTISCHIVEKMVSLNRKGVDEMYCGECGAKLEKDATFCGECGAPVKKEKETAHKSSEKKEESTHVDRPPRKPMSKKTKIISVIVIVVIVGLFAAYQIVGNQFSVKTMAKEYVEALADNDWNKLYSYLNLEGDTTFVSQDIFKELMGDSESKIKNFSIGEVTYDEGKLSASVTVHYTEEGSSQEKTDIVYLSKEKEKKYLIFDNWTVDNNIDSLIVEDYKIIVPKGSKIVLEGINVEDKYLDEKSSDDTTDAYRIPQVFSNTLDLKTTLPNGMAIDEEITPSNYYSSHTVELSLSNLSDEAVDTLEEQAKNSLTAIYQSLIAKQAFADIKSTYEFEGGDIASLEEEYTNTLDDLNTASTTLKQIEFTSLNIRSVELEDGILNINVKANYNYQVEYQDYLSEQLATHDDKDYAYITLGYIYQDGSYHLTSLDGLVSYFSRY